MPPHVPMSFEVVCEGTAQAEEDREAFVKRGMNGQFSREQSLLLFELFEEIKKGLYSTEQKKV